MRVQDIPGDFRRVQEIVQESSVEFRRIKESSEVFNRVQVNLGEFREFRRAQ
jgi:hypothetical protein